jgi:Tfp pilus assembly protein PilN
MPQLYILAFVGVLALAIFGTYEYRGWQVDRLQVKNAELEAQLSSAQEARKEIEREAATSARISTKIIEADRLRGETIRTIIRERVVNAAPVPAQWPEIGPATLGVLDGLRNLQNANRQNNPASASPNLPR